MTKTEQLEALVIGGGPAGLKAADTLSDAGVKVVIVDAKPSVGRKFLMAGKSGLNLTKNEPIEPFLDAYGEAREWLAPIVRSFGPDNVIEWAQNFGQDIFTGSSGRVFPKVMKASPLLRNWLSHLDGKGVEIRNRWIWKGWRGDDFVFDTAQGPRLIRANVAVLALGGASWSKLGSDGAWRAYFAQEDIAPFKPANMGFLVNWSKHMEPHFGAPIKPARPICGDVSIKGEFVLTKRGIEGSAVYALSKTIRNRMDTGDVVLSVDLVPDMSLEQVQKRLSNPRGKMSLANYLRKNLGISGAKKALFFEFNPPDDPQEIASYVKAVPIPLVSATPIDEAISTAGGIKQTALTEKLMLKRRRGVFCAGEMLDWEAPTGGYLLTACLATGLHAGHGAAEYINL